MSEQLVTCLISVAANLAGIMIIYCVMAQALVGLVWRRRGIFGVIALIVVAQLFWLAPALLIVGNRNPDDASSSALWFGNSLVCGFSLVLLRRTAKCIPRALEDSARLDGLGAFDIWRRIVFPFVRRDLLLIAIFTVTATLVPYWSFVAVTEAGGAIVLYQKATTPTERILFMTVVSLIGALPLIAIFFLDRRSRASSAN